MPCQSRLEINKQIYAQSLDAGEGLVGIAIGHKGERGVGKLFWRGLGWRVAGPEPPVERKTETTR